ISRNNPDETAKNFFLLLQAAKIDRRRTVLWNIIPWYIGTGVRIREATATDIRTAEPALHELATLLPRVRTVVLVGRKASNKKTQWLIGDLFPAVRIFSIFHPSPLYINNAPGNRDVLLQQLGEV